MKEKIINFTFCCFCFIALFFIFKNNNQVAHVIITAVNLFLNRVFVSLFPMFILNDFLINCGLPILFYHMFNPLFKKLFKTSGTCAYVFIMSLISGTPSQAVILKNLVATKLITTEEANHFMMFTYFSNPLFLVMMLSVIFPTNTAIKLIFIHYFSNIIIGLIVRNKVPLNIENITINQIINKTTLTSSISKAMSTLLMILGTIVFYMLLTYIIINILPVHGIFKVLVSGVLEITNGLHMLVSYTATSKIKEILAVAIISFGGLSIHTQIKALIEDTNISYNYFLKGRIMQTIISIILAIIF